MKQISYNPDQYRNNKLDDPMLQQDSTLHFNAVVRGLLRAAKTQGIDPQKCVEGTGLRESDLVNRDRLITIRQEYLIFSNFLKLFGKDDWGFRWYDYARDNVIKMGLYGYTLMSAPTLRDMINFLYYGNSLTSSGFYYSLKEADGVVQVFMRPKFDFAECTRLRFDIEVAVLFGQFSALLERRFKPVLVSMMHDATADKALYYDFFDCDVIFDAPFNRIDFDIDLLDEPLPNGNQTVFEICRDRSLEELQSLAFRQAPTSWKLLTLIEKERKFLITKGQAAAAINLSSRTLSRKLEAEGNTFKDILSNARLNAAFNLLINSELLIEEISYELGFSSQSAFTHSFKRVTGQSPVKYRETAKASL